jgi:AcrR family transcriptional regulator
MADIGESAGMRGPSLYNHVESKQSILFAIMAETMEQLIDGQTKALAATTGAGAVVQLRAVTEAHIRYHLRHRLEAFVGNSELRSLDVENFNAILRARTRYERGLRTVVRRAAKERHTTIESPKLVSFAILDLGMGAAVWYRPERSLTEDYLVDLYGKLALRLVGIQDEER